MQFAQFLGRVQSRAHLESPEAALKATRATLATLAQRLGSNEPANLAAQLPAEIARFLHTEDQGERFSSDEFFQRVSERTGADLPDAVFQARVVLEVLGEAVSTGQLQDLRSQLPDDYQRIFRSGSEGHMQ